MKHKKGFTLIEILIVVLIIGILAAIALPQYQLAVGKAESRQAVIVLTAITNAQETFYLATGTYTDDLSQLDIAIDSNDKYFEYRCLVDGYKSCIAFPIKEGLPVFEFVLSGNIGRKGSPKWCQTEQIPMTPKAQKQAETICASLGSLYPSLEERGYYYMQ